MDAQINTISLDGELVAWSVCVVPDEGAPYVELVGLAETRQGTEAALAWVAKYKGLLNAVVVDGQSGAADFADRVRALRIRKRRVSVATTGDYIDACAMLTAAVREHTVAHIEQGPLDDSARMSRRRKVGRSGVGADDGPDVPCAPVESAASASSTTAGRHSGCTINLASGYCALMRRTSSGNHYICATFRKQKRHVFSKAAPAACHKNRLS